MSRSSVRSRFWPQTENSNSYGFEIIDPEANELLFPVIKASEIKSLERIHWISYPWVAAQLFLAF